MYSTTARSPTTYFISTAHTKFGRAFDLLVQPSIAESICDLLGADVIGWGPHYFCIYPVAFDQLIAGGNQVEIEASGDDVEPTKMWIEVFY